METQKDPLEACPLCGNAVKRPTEDSGDGLSIVCVNCGRFRVTRSALAEITTGAVDALDLPRVAHGVRRMGGEPTLDTHLLHKLIDEVELPDGLAQIDNVVLLVGRRRPPGVSISLVPDRLTASLGSLAVESAQWAIQSACDLGYLTGQSSNKQQGRLDSAVLTPKGWEYYRKLMTEATGSKHAFMAMKFGDRQLDAIYRDHMKPAVAQTDFELRRTDEAHKTAGLIDNRMRVEIRTARFLVCDLSHGNQGAYWEAGFAEGIGRPVIYTCSREAFESADATERPHFDTAHQPIIVWDPADPASAMAELKDMIRATLPLEARMSDSASP
ncbi:MAG: hypothetical protein KIT35_03210 [Piscinibacter sp.]|uniref:hypothetical protein n=1 Tax=Piscinibacter sp. TaxID=1903157 RepID=UPI00258AD6EB|nr:hypothetical protein [Piscinibacter sp.]MCW5662821.1 hypothetical protein [Piscinibacter sp.]